MQCRWLVLPPLLLLLSFAAASTHLLRAGEEQSVILCGYGAGALGPDTAIALETVRAAHPLARLFYAYHEYTDDQFYGHSAGEWKASEEEQAWLASLRVTLVTVKPDETPLHASVLKHFRQHSSSPVVYERFCLLRFVTVAHVIAKHGLRGALFVDSDVLAFANLLELYGVNADWALGSWTSSWSATGASAFASFLEVFYN